MKACWVQECVLGSSLPLHFVLQWAWKDSSCPLWQGLYPFRAACGISALSSNLNCPLLSVWPSDFTFSVICSMAMVYYSSIFLTFCLFFLFVMVLLAKCHLWCIRAERVLLLPQAPEENTACTGAGASSSPACPLAMDSLVMRSPMFSPAHPYFSVLDLSRSNR